MSFSRHTPNASPNARRKAPATLNASFAHWVSSVKNEALCGDLSPLLPLQPDAGQLASDPATREHGQRESAGRPSVFPFLRSSEILPKTAPRFLSRTRFFGHAHQKALSNAKKESAAREDFCIFAAVPESRRTFFCVI